MSADIERMFRMKALSDVLNDETLGLKSPYRRIQRFGPYPNVLRETVHTHLIDCQARLASLPIAPLDFLLISTLLMGHEFDELGMKQDIVAHRKSESDRSKAELAIVNSKMPTDIKEMLLKLREHGHALKTGKTLVEPDARYLLADTIDKVDAVEKFQLALSAWCRLYLHSHNSHSGNIPDVAAQTYGFKLLRKYLKNLSKIEAQPELTRLAQNLLLYTLWLITAEWQSLKPAQVPLPIKIQLVLSQSLLRHHGINVQASEPQLEGLSSYLILGLMTT